MRPVEKKRPGELICYTDSNNQKIEHRIKEHYPNYGDAKFPLSANIGAFCSYCEDVKNPHAGCGTSCR